MMQSPKMKTLSKKNRWLLTSSAAITLALVGMSGEVAHADTDTATTDGQHQVTAGNDLQADQVTLTPTEAADDPSADTTTTTTDDATTDEEPTTTPETDQPADTTAPTETEPEAPTTSEPDETPSETAGEQEATTSPSPETSVDTTIVDPTTEPETDLNDSTEPTTDWETAQARYGIQATSAPVLFAVASDPVNLAATESIDDWMPNKLLQQQILKILKKLSGTGKTWNSVTDITKDDMALITSIYNDDTYIDGVSSYSLEGLQYAINLEHISLNAGLNAPSMHYYGDVTDISPLGNLQKLREVNIQNNRITDISPLANLQSVTDIAASFNHVADFSSLKPLADRGVSISYGNQVIILPPIYVSNTDRTAHLPSVAYHPDGTKVTLTAKPYVGEPVTFNPNTYQFTYRFYLDESQSTPDGEGGLNFTNIPDQEPGITGEYMGATVVPQKDKYFLLGAYKDSIVQFAVVQPYILTDSAESVTVHYRDDQGNTIADDIVLDQGMIGQDYTTEQLTIPGYTFKEVQGNPTGQFTDEAQTVTYIYTADKAGAVTVHYQDDQGNTIADDIILSDGKIGDDYATDQLTIKNYTFKEVQGNPTGKYTDAPQTVTYVYTLNDAASITVHYQDDQGNTIADDIVLSDGQIGDDYTTEQLTIPGYAFKEVQGNPTGKYSEDAQTVTYVYTSTQAAPITVHYQDDQGNTIAKDIVLSDGQIGDDYVTEQLTIPGYAFKEVQGNPTGKYGKDAQTVTYIYTSTQAAPVTVHYQDDQGNTIAKDVVLSDGQIGDDYATEQLTIPGYTFKEVRGNATGQYTDEAQTVTYVYTKTTSGGGGDGGTGGGDTGGGDTGGGDTGGNGGGTVTEPENPTPPVTPPTEPTTPDLGSGGDAATGTDNATPGSAGDTAAQPTPLTTSGNGATVSNTGTTQSMTTPATTTKTTAAALPQTDERQQNTSILGLLVLGVTALGAFFFKRRRN